MNATALAWFLVTSGYGYGVGVVYSPPMQNVEDCRRLQDALIKSRIAQIAQCVQLNVYLGGK